MFHTYPFYLCNYRKIAYGNWTKGNNWKCSETVLLSVVCGRVGMGFVIGPQRDKITSKCKLYQ